jgi:hypothetical protein
VDVVCVHHVDVPAGAERETRRVVLEVDRRAVEHDRVARRVDQVGGRRVQRRDLWRRVAGRDQDARLAFMARRITHGQAHGRVLRRREDVVRGRSEVQAGAGDLPLEIERLAFRIL